MKQENESHNQTTYTRRQAMGILLGGLAALSLPGCGSPPTEAPKPQPTDGMNIKPDYKLLISSEAHDVPLPAEIQYTPDTHVPFIRQKDGSLLMFVSGNRGTYPVLVDTGLSRATPVVLSGSQNIAEVVGPRPEEDIDYEAISGVVKDKQNRLIGFTHREHWPTHTNGTGFTASVGMTVSQDNGFNWRSIPAAVITGMEALQPGKRVSGAGQPCAIVVGDEVRVYYTDWNTKNPDAIHVARAPLANIQDRNAWQKFYNGNFSEPGVDGKSTPVILPTNERANYAALAGVSFNTKLKAFLCVYESTDGFYTAISPDGISWQSYQKIADFPQTQASRKKGDTWFSYPTIISPQESDDTVTDGEGWLVYSQGIWEVSSHHMVARKISIE